MQKAKARDIFANIIVSHTILLYIFLITHTYLNNK
jgi:hypothetical protein